MQKNKSSTSLLVMAQKLLPTGHSLLFVVVGQHFRYPPYTQFVLSEIFLDNIVSKLRKLFSQAMNCQLTIRSQFLVHLGNDFISQDTGPASLKTVFQSTNI
ncbi:hypothetical protein J6590_042789 [Homalodisca vitripennis]|nr:hypothetical protein J6590_042789 [Homalodisca vitripennis]